MNGTGETVSPFLALATRVRSVLGIAFIVPYTILCSFFVISAGVLKLDGCASWFIRFWAQAVLFVFGIKVIHEGDENLPVRGGGIIVFNHQSLFDIPVLVATTKNIRFGAKIELFKIPFFGPAMRAVGTLPIARESRGEVMKIYRDAETRFSRDIIFVLAPEGTRQEEPVIGRFKKGPFIFAINAHVPIIPAVIKGAHPVLPKGSLSVNFGKWKREIRLSYLSPVDTSSFGPRQSESLMTHVREKMCDCYDRLPVDV